MSKLKLFVVALSLLCLVNCFAITQIRTSQNNPYVNINPSMLEAVQNVNEGILKKKAITSFLLLPARRWELRSVKAISDIHVGATVFADDIPAASVMPATKTVGFHISPETAESITKIADISQGTETSCTYHPTAPGYNEKLVNGCSTNYVYAIGLSRFQVYEYTYYAKSLFNAELKRQVKRVAVPAGDWVYQLEVCQEAVKVHIESATKDKVLTWDSYSSYIQDLISVENTADVRASKCVFF